MKKITRQKTIKVHGNFAVQAMRMVLLGLVGALDTTVEFFAKRLDDATQKVVALLGGSREAKSKLKGGVAEKTPASKALSRLVGRFSNHLDSHEQNVIDRTKFFTTDGTIRGIGRSVPQLLSAVEEIVAELKKKDCPVKDAASWRKQLGDAAAALTPAVAMTEQARVAGMALKPEVAAAIAEWQNAYEAAKCHAQSVLLVAGKLELLNGLFLDLSAPAKRQPKSAASDPNARQVAKKVKRARNGAQAADTKTAAQDAKATHSGEQAQAASPSPVQSIQATVSVASPLEARQEPKAA